MQARSRPRRPENALAPAAAAAIMPAMTGATPPVPPPPPPNEAGAAGPLPDPDRLVLPDAAPRARRELRVFGAAVELVWLPDRAARQGRPGAQRPAFAADAGARIVAAEAQWRGRGAAVTPNRYPFASRHAIVWPDAPLRAPDVAFWTLLAELADHRGGTLLLNSVGAAASIARTHAHWTAETLPFLDQLPESPLAADWLPRIDGAAFAQKDVPCALVGVRGAPVARAEALAALQTLRLSPAWNALLTRGAAWLLPRAVETPLPHFPYPLGAAELWGRWCWLDEAPFAAATGPELERALCAAGVSSRR